MDQNQDLFIPDYSVFFFLDQLLLIKISETKNHCLSFLTNINDHISCLRLLLPERELNRPPRAAGNDGKLGSESGVPGGCLRRIQLLETDDDVSGSERHVFVNRKSTVHPRPHGLNVVFVLLQCGQGTCGERWRTIRALSGKRVCVEF